GPGPWLPARARLSRAPHADQGGGLRSAGAVRLAPDGADDMNNPILGLTMGDPAGVGPEIIVRAGAEPEVQRTSRPVVIGAAATLGEALALVGSPLRLHSVTQVAECRWQPGTLEVLDLANVDMATLPRARVSAAAGRAAYEYIETAVALAKAGVIHVTTHVALRRVPDLVTRDRVLRTIQLAQRTLEGLGIPRGRIAVAGLNPHAGEDGLFGDEEKTAIVPAIEAARGEGLNVAGPLPADTLFSRARGGDFDVVVA